MESIVAVILGLDPGIHPRFAGLKTIDSRLRTSGMTAKSLTIYTDSN
jgi:hypothetical protein